MVKIGGLKSHILAYNKLLFIKFWKILIGNHWKKYENLKDIFVLDFVIQKFSDWF